MNWLLLFVPVAIGLEFLAPDRHLLIFVTSSLALLPLAAWVGLGHRIACDTHRRRSWRASQRDFGNAAELIIALVALRAGLHDVVE